MFQRYSRQREVVYGILSATDTHPTAEWIYFEAKKVLPNISLATVYRNLRELVAADMAKVVLTKDAKEHFDADVSQHCHFVCESCGKVFDVKTKFDQSVQGVEEEGFVVEKCDVVFFGKCNNCSEIH